MLPQGMLKHGAQLAISSRSRLCPIPWFRDSDRRTNGVMICGVSGEYLNSARPVFTLLYDSKGQNQPGTKGTGAQDITTSVPVSEWTISTCKN